MQFTRSGLLALTLTSLLAFPACDGSEGGSTERVSGVIIGPEGAAASTARLRGFSQTDSPTGTLSAHVNGADDCAGDVPSGYTRLSGVEVILLDADGNPLDETLTTDDCGIFQGEVPEATASIRAEPTGMRPIEVEVAVFAGGADPTIVSTISGSAEYEIRSLFRQSDGRFGFTVADSESGRPVIGIPASRFSLDVSGTDVPLESVDVAGYGQEAATVALALDVSWSMHSRVYQDGEGNNFMRYHLARDGAHLFLNEKGENDETEIVYFDGTVRPVNDAYLASNFTFVDDGGANTDYLTSESGFTRRAADLRLVVDALSPYNQIYQNPIANCTEHVPCSGTAGGDYAHPGIQRAPHEDAAPLRIASAPLVPNGTAVWDAVSHSLDVSADRPLARKAVVTLGDGGDNRSSSSLNQTISKANDLGIPVYAIALGVGANDPAAEAALERLGVESGGDFVSVDDVGAEVELLRVFESIQTGIVFQYLATLDDDGDVAPGDVVTLRLQYNGLVTTRSFTVVG